MKYTGIGSRTCPSNDCQKLSRIAQILALRRHVLRSGGADGADKAFEVGHLSVNKVMEIYIPWSKFVSKLEQYHLINLDKEIESKAESIASSIHPAWNRCSQGAKKLHTRNVYQVLGRRLTEPSSFLIAWTPNGDTVGGSRTAIVLAENHKIPVFNIESIELRNLSAMEIVKHISTRTTEKL